MDALATFNYVAWQNAVPLLRSLTVENPGPDVISGATLELIASPPFIRPKTWPIDRVVAGESVALREIDVDVDVDFLDRLDEAERGVLTFQLRGATGVLAETRHEVRVLSRDEWGGMGSMAELLPSFVTPNDPTLAPLLKDASRVLEDHGHSGALDGYQARDPNRTFLLAAALWSAVAARSLTYANPPGSFEQVGQKTRRIGAILHDGLATCLDTTLLFASGLEAIGLHPILVLTQGHCFAGVWLNDLMLKKLVEPDCSELRKAIAARELLVFETTLVTQRPGVSFDQARMAAEASLGEAREHEFVAAIDVARARMASIRPLATRGERPAGDGHASPSSTSPLALPDAPRYATDSDGDDDPPATTPDGRIDRWQRKLLDLSLRNRLLNYRSTKQCIPLLCPDLASLEDHLADSTRLRLVSLLDENRIGNRDHGLHRERTQQDLDTEFASRALERNELACSLDARELEARLTSLLRKVKNDLAEGGTNTLFLALGFVKWRKTPNDAKTYRAPILLLPVQLTRSSATAPFYLASHGDEPRFNATLVQLLKRDFQCDLGALEANLPGDESGLDIPAIFEKTRRAIRDVPGFEVVEESALASFSFAKYLMWKDLVDRIELLDQNRVVRHLVHDPDQPFLRDDASPLPRAHEMDTRYTPRELVHPLPADSSQLAAVMAVSEGHDLVIVGPPGTGKSQTIANLIAQCLSEGKTVLFVAEKTAALDVVHRRLREHGLGDCAVELHSNKAERRKFLEQLDQSWKRPAPAADDEWLSISERLRVRRDELNAYVAAIHAVHPNGWSVYRAMGVSVEGGHADCPPLAWRNDVRHDAAEYSSLTEAVANVASARRALPAGADLKRVEAIEWSMAWESDLLENSRQLRESAERLSLAANSLVAILDANPLPDLSIKRLTGLYRVATELLKSDPPQAEILLHANPMGLRTVLEERAALLGTRAEATATSQQAMASFRAAFQLPDSTDTSNSTESHCLQLAAAITGPDAVGAPLLFHPQLESLPQAVSTLLDRSRKLDEARAALVARSYSAALLGHLPIESLLREWLHASNAFWPFSLWKKFSVKQKLRTYVAPGAIPDPGFDLPLLATYAESLAQVEEQRRSLALPPHLEAALRESPGALATPIDAALRLRQVIQEAGGSVATKDADVNATTHRMIASAETLLAARRTLEAVAGQLDANLQRLDLPETLRHLAKDDTGGVMASIEAAHQLKNSLLNAEFSQEQLTAALQRLSSTSATTRRATATEFFQQSRQFSDIWKTHATLAGATPAPQESRQVLLDVRQQAEAILGQRALLRPWTMWIAARRRAEQLGLGSFAAAIWSGELAPQDAIPRLELAYARWWLPLALDASPPLRGFQKTRHEEAIEEFRALDDVARRAAAPHALRALHHGLPDRTLVPRMSELGQLRHQLSLKKPSRSIRDIITNMPDSFRKLAPCLLMSPLSIAQYLPPGEALFDVVVFDEASQIATWDAIGAIARGRQTIIVGDPKQLPPTNFFGRTEDDEANEELPDHMKDLESILDEVQASGMPTVQLNWHYRSRHESLIAFSNQSYYGGALITFPAAESADRGVSLTIVENALYDRGNTRTNRREAEAIVADAVARMKQSMALPEDARPTFGVVTFNSQQQTLIQDLFDEALRAAPELEWFFADERIEPAAVKNLENVQGDERDIMYFSITFGRDSRGKFPVDFGAINRTGGERRLNVAVTRARQALFVYASFAPDQLQADRSAARGVHDLRRFLEFAQRGPTVLAARSGDATGSDDCPLERSIAKALTDRGWRVERRVGVSGFRVDLGILHPDKPDTYLAGVECDGATYRRSATARDRDKTRAQVLEGLGWKILRVWSADWSYDPIGAAEALHAQLLELTK